MADALQKLGVRSFGIYLVHSLGIILAAKAISRLLPGLLPHQLLLQPLLIAAALITPLGLMWLVDHSPFRRYYRYHLRLNAVYSIKRSKPTMTQGTETILMDYIKNDLIRDRKSTISPDDDLLANGTIDSLGILQIVAFVDERFGLRVPDEDVTYENFKSVRALSDYLSQLQ